jgi:sodium/proline symporter
VEREEEGLMDPILVGFLGYLLIVLIVGFITARLNKTLPDYLLAGRRLGSWVVAFSERASGESAWLLLGLPALAWMAGYSAFWDAVGCCSGILFSWIVVSRRLRTDSEAHEAITLPRYFEAKYDDKTQALKLTATVIIVFFFTIYVAAQLLGAGKVLHFFLGVDKMHGMLIGGGIILFYTMMGGFFAVAWTDMFQGILMLVTLFLLPLLGLIYLGFFSPLNETIASAPSDYFFTFADGSQFSAWHMGLTSLGTIFAGIGNPHLLVFSLNEFARPEVMSAISENMQNNSSNFLSIVAGRSGWPMWAGILGGLGIGLGYMGQPHLLTRFMAIKDPNKLRQGSLVAVTWALLAFWGAVLIGIVANGIVRTHSIDFGELMVLFNDPEKVMPFLASFLLPAWLAGILISGAIAAMMSTADSQLLVSTSALSEDVYHQMINKQASQRRLVFLSRAATLAIGIIAFILAISAQELVYDLVLYAWAGLGAAFGPGLLMTLWWRRTTKWGVLAGMIVGTATVIIWKNVPALDAFIYEIIPGFVFAFVSVIFVSLITQDSRKPKQK